MRWTAEQADEASRRIRERIAHPLDDVPTTPPSRGIKYGNKRVAWQGQMFDSKRELKCYQDFLLRLQAGEIRAVIRQVSMTLALSKRRIRVDFLIIENDGAHKWYDAKGYMTVAWAGKRAQIKDAYGIDIQLI